MLIKTLKMDLKSTCRFFLGMSILMAGVVCFGMIQNEKVTIIVAFAFAFVNIAISLGSFVIMINHYEKSMFKSDSYLIRSFPIKDWTQVLSKLIVGIFWTFFSFGIAFLASWALKYISPLMEVQFHFELTEVLKVLWISVIAISTIYLTAFLAIELAYMDRFSGHRTILAIVFFVGLCLFQAWLEYLFEVFIYNISLNDVVMYIYNIMILSALFYANVWLLKHKTGVENY